MPGGGDSVKVAVRVRPFNQVIIPFFVHFINKYSVASKPSTEIDRPLHRIYSPISLYLNLPILFSMGTFLKNVYWHTPEICSDFIDLTLGQKGSYFVYMFLR